MKRTIRSFVRATSLAFAGVFLGSSMFAQTVHEDFIDGQIWFRLKTDKAVHLQENHQGNAPTDFNNMSLSSMPYLRDVFTAHSVTKLVRPFPKAYGSEDLLNTYRLEFADINNVENIIDELVESGAVVYAEKVPLMHTTLSPNDPLHNTSNMWGLFQVNAEQAWNIGTGSASIVVAVVDNAVEIGHSDLTNVIWTNPVEASGTPGVDDDGNGFIDDINGWDAGGNSGTPDNDPNPPSSAWDHGTHCSGTVGAETNNNNGLSSIGFGISVMAIKATRNNAGSNSVTHGYDGIYYAAINDADVISCSWGGTGFSTTGQNMVNWATSQGSIVVAAAGNDGTDNDVTPHYPSNYSNAVAVASTTTGDNKSGFSNYGANSIDICAPGSNIASTVPFNNYSFMSGTSMATPMVSGLLGLMKSLNPSMPNSALLNCMYTTAVNIDAQNPAYAGELGNGRIDAFAAMNCVAATLSNPPVADFSANITTVVAGGTVTFTDQSTFGPTTWAWNFDNQSLGGVTPATASTQGPHMVTYNNPGTYEVSLTVTNPNGNDTETKTGYIVVTTPGACNELNLDDNTFSSIASIHVGWNAALYTFGAGSGWVTGTNTLGDKAHAEYFPAAVVGSNTQYVQGVYLWMNNASVGSGTKTIDINVWDATGGLPTGAPIATRTVAMNTLSNGTIRYYQFPTPVQVPASSEIAVGVDISNLTWTTDSFSIPSSTVGDPSTTLGLRQKADNSWENYGAFWSGDRSLYIFPQLTANPATAALAANPTTICEGDQVHYDATGSTFGDTLLWSFPGQTPATSNNVMDSIIYNSSGTYTTYLEVVGGGCSRYAIDSVTITVNPTPNLSIAATADTICNGNSTQLTASGGGTYSWTPSGSGNPISVSPTTNTTWSVTSTVAGCTGEASKTIYVVDPPTAVAQHTLGLKCTDQTVNFDGTNSVDANTYSWSFPAGSPSIGSSTSPFPVVTFGTAGFHAYSLTVTNACGTHTQNRNLTISQSPTVTATATATTICQGDPVTLTGTGNAASYSWDNSVVDGVAFTPGATNTYTVTGTAANGCETTDQITVTVNICTGLDELNTDVFTIFPNPTNNILNITGLDNVKSMSLLDVTGKLVFETANIVGNSMTIDLSKASNGMYFLQVQTNDGLESYKVVKQ